MLEILYLSVLLFLFVKFLFFPQSWENWGDRIFVTVMTLLIGAFAYGLIFSSSFNVFKKETSRIDNFAQIYSLSNGMTTQGSFVLGSGQVNSVEKYFTFIKDSDGGFRRFSVNANSGRLFLRDDMAPQLHWQTVQYGAPKWLSISGLWTSEEFTSADIICPSSTLIQKFEVK